MIILKIDAFVTNYVCAWHLCDLTYFFIISCKCQMLWELMNEFIATVFGNLNVCQFSNVAKKSETTYRQHFIAFTLNVTNSEHDAKKNKIT
jgi:hypothetical protein